MNWFKRKSAPTPTQREAEMATIIEELHKALAAASDVRTALIAQNGRLTAKLEIAENNYNFACQQAVLFQLQLEEKA